MFLEDIKARGLEPRGIIDVGANRGDWTVMALSVFPDARVMMIEPQREMRAFLSQLCAMNPKVQWVEAGAGRERGELAQTIWDDLAASSFVPQASEEAIRAGRQRLTPVVTINELLRERPDFMPDLVKLDVQGYELEALKGASDLFGRTEVMILETSLYRFMPGMPMTADCIQFMAERGYDLYEVLGGLRRPLDGALGQVDLAFAKTGGSLLLSNEWSAAQGAIAATG